MRRVRITLLLVALGLGIPVALLAWRALDGLALERAVRHQALAERAFDEMERVLSAWLAAEEARPFEHYRFYVQPGEPSPLSSPADPFVIGAFQVDPDGSVHTPMQPRDVEAARARGDWPPPPEVQAAIGRVTALAREIGSEGWVRADAQPAPERVAGKSAAGKKEAARLDPGTTRAIGGRTATRLESLAKADLDTPRGEEEEGVSVYDAFQSLNRGAELRRQRKQKVVEATLPEAFADRYAASAPESAGAPRTAAPSAPTPEEEAFADAENARRDAVDATRPLRALGYVTSREPVDDAPAEGKAVPARAQDDAPSLRVALDPMVGRIAGDGTLVLTRTVLVGAQGFRQGLVLDRDALSRWLSARALGPSGLSRVATLAFGDAAPVDGAYAFQHRFAEPFDALTARLTLAALPGVAGPGAIHGLVLALALVGAVGLFAIHRMVAVTVHFADRRSNFVAAVTHELKTPLTAIRMYAEMLRDGLVPGESKRREYYGTITDESERLSRLIDNVLEFSRLERGTREMHLQVGPLGPVVGEAVDKLRAHAASQGFELELDLDPALPPVRYDRDALLQVIFNLVDNAMKYAGAASARRVVIEARAAAGDGVELAVRDFGPGVSRRHLARIFEPFYRAEDERTRETKGTGIGLALVRDLAERMGARVRGDNAEGGGFRVSLAFAPRSQPG